MLIIKNIIHHSLPGKRSFYAALNYIFNRVSRTRIKEVGPDRACAEWLMRNGAFVRWKGQPKFVEHYNNLPLDEKDRAQYFIEEIDAKDASISHHGFAHLDGCNHISKIRFHNCWYIDDQTLGQLGIIAHTLCELEITKCGEVTDIGLASLEQLRKLRDLKLGSLLGVKDLNKCVADLQKSLPQCGVQIIRD